MNAVFRRRLRKALLALVLAIALLFAALFVKIRFFQPRFDVVSIASLPAYQNAALLDRAWSLPVARTFLHELDFQSNGSICGPASIANVFRSLGEGPVTPRAVLEGTGKCPLDFCFNGLTLDELADVARSKSRRSVTVLSGLTLDEFRMHMRHTNDANRRYLVNFQRALLFGEGFGHHSPIAGYLEDRDLVFVLDVNAKFGPWLVPTDRLHQAANAPDPTTNKPRGLLLIQ
jgi:hypothetical protein